MTTPAQLATSMRHLAQIRSYAELLAALRARADDLGVTREGLDAITGLQSGYAGKLLAPVPIKSLGKFSMGPMLSAMGCMLILVEDADTLKRITSRVPKRVNSNQAGDAGGTMPARRKRQRKGFRTAEVGKLLRARQVLAQSAKRRSEIATTAAKARWRDHVSKRKTKELARRARQARATHKARKSGASNQPG